MSKFEISAVLEIIVGHANALSLDAAVSAAQDAFTLIAATPPTVEVRFVLDGFEDEDDDRELWELPIAAEYFVFFGAAMSRLDTHHVVAARMAPETTLVLLECISANVARHGTANGSNAPSTDRVQ